MGGTVSGMLLLLRSQLRFLARNPVGTAVTVFGIALAVTSVVTVHLTGQTLAGAVRDTQAFAGYSHVATRPSLTEESYFALRARWRSGEWSELAGLLPVVEGTVRIGGELRRLVGIEPLADIGYSDRAMAGADPSEAAMPAGLERFLTADVVATSRARAAGSNGARRPPTGHLSGRVGGWRRAVCRPAHGVATARTSRST